MDSESMNVDVDGVSWLDPILWDVMKHLVFGGGILAPKALKMARQVCKLWHSWVAFPSIKLSPKRLAKIGDAIFSSYMQHVETVYLEEFENDDLPMLITSPILFPPSGSNKLRRIVFRSSTLGPYGAKLLADVLSQNKTVTDLNLWYCNIENAGVAEICSLFSTLKKIDLTSNMITYEGSKAISDSLKANNISLNSLILTGNLLTPAGLDLIADALKTNTSLHTLILKVPNEAAAYSLDSLADALIKTTSLREIHFGANFSVSIANALAHNKSLKYISSTHAPMDLNGINVLGNALNLNNDLETLDISYWPLFDDGASIIANSLVSNRALTSLNLCNSRLNNAGAISLATMLGSNSTLLQFDLSGNAIEVDGVVALGNALAVNRTLTSLNLSSNFGLAPGIPAGFAAGLAVNEGLLELIFDRNHIPAEGGIALAQALTQNTTLQRLICSHNNFGDAGIIAFSQAIAQNSSLVHLDLSYTTCDLPPQITPALISNTCLRSLSLRHNSISDMGATFLARALKSNRTLTSLDLEYNEIGVGGAVELASALDQNDAISRFNIGHNDIGDDGAVALANVLQRKSTPIDVCVTSNRISPGGEAFHALNQAKLKNLNLSLDWTF